MHLSLQPCIERSTQLWGCHRDGVNLRVIVKMSAGNEEPRTKLWRWAEPYQYPIPEPDGDHWNIVLEPLIKKDRIRCEAWKDEVQNLLIFAGLFSSVVTGFAIESYKNLQPDPADATTLLLARIAARLDNTTESPITPFSPSASAIRINAFWFLSLVLSLTTVLVGIVSLQWLREHQRYTEPLTAKDTLAVFHMRAKALEDWRIPQIFTGLPLILQAAVVLFFIGIADFLVMLDLAVAIPVSVLIGVTITFLLATTALPTMQSFLTPRASGGCVPSQCPYKSPQSWAFRALFITLARAFYRLGACVKVLFDAKDARISIPRSFCLQPEHRDWIDVDTSWLSIRDAHFLLSRGISAIELEDRIRPPYDLVHALASTVEEQSAKSEVVLAGYQCYRDLSHAISNEAEELELRSRSGAVKSYQDASEITRQHARIVNLQSCFAILAELPTISSSLTTLDLRIMHYESMLLFLELPGMRNYATEPTHMIGMHRIELHTRIWVFIFYNRPEDPADAITVASHHPLLSQVEYVENLYDIPDRLLEDVVSQHYRILGWIFEQAINIGSDDSPTSILGYAMLDDFIAYVAWFRPPTALEARFLGVLDVISRGLTFALNSHGYDSADFLFFCARLYLERVAQHIWFAELMQFGAYATRHRVVSVLRTLRIYEGRLDTANYSCLVEFWRAERLRPRATRVVQRNRVPAIVYKPITENLLRFIPYEP